MSKRTGNRRDKLMNQFDTIIQRCHLSIQPILKPTYYELKLEKMVSCVVAIGNLHNMKITTNINKMQMKQFVVSSQID